MQDTSLENETEDEAEIARAIRNEYEAKIGVGEFQLTRFLPKPVNIGSSALDKLDSQREKIERFLKSVFEIGRQALRENNTQIQRLLFSEAVGVMDIEYHKSLPDFCWMPPIFYRTDQSVSGKIYEIQAPGSGWGDLIIITKVLQNMGYSISDKYLHFADNYADTIVRLTTGDKNVKPMIYHMIDASSAPASMKYLMAVTLHKLRYWGLSDGVTQDKVDYVTSHSAASLTTSNYFKKYSENAVKGSVVFGIPPNLLFDQKAIYALPFHRATKDLFSDDIRELFPFTSVVENNGFYDKDGKFVIFDDFIHRPEKNRLYYLKYGGPDLCRNWGSRSVYRLDGTDCAKRIKEAIEGSNNGDIWLIQEDVSKEELAGASSDIQKIVSQKEHRHIKLSAFNSCDCQLGVRVSARRHFKVHSQHDTYIGIAIAET